jgi:hypothetical protein
LLCAERTAAADFLLALADFDRRRGWQPLGHASLFAFLHVELKLPNASAFWRTSAARLLQRFPDVIDPIRDGRLCLSTTAELARVLTAENRAEVLPRFFGLSAREAKEVVAELQPREAPPTRMVVTNASSAQAARSPGFAQAPLTLAAAPASGPHPNVVPPTQLRTSEVDFGGSARTAPARDDVEPLTADLRRLHVTVSRQFLKKLDAARDGLSHSIPGASTEQVFEAALDLLLEKRARARGQVKKPRTTLPATPKTAPQPQTTPRTGQAASATGEQQPHGPPLALVLTEPPPHRRDGPREAIPAAVRRADWERDGGRCVWPLDGGGRCGSTHRIELDHQLPWARCGTPTVEGLRLLCHSHNSLAARLAFGERCMERYAGPARRRALARQAPPPSVTIRP